MLADKRAAIRDQRLGCFLFQVKARPVVDISDLHCRGRADRSRAEVEGGVAADYFRERECAHIADHSLIRRNLARFDHFVELHAGDNARHIAGFIYRGEVVVHVCKTAGLRLIARRMAELNLRVFLRRLNDERFEIKAICKDDVAALLRQIDRRVIAGLVLRRVPLENQLVILQAQRFLHSFGAVVVRRRVSLVFIANVDEPDLQVILRHTLDNGRVSCLAALGRRSVFFLLFARSKGEDHRDCHQQANNFFHAVSSNGKMEILLPNHITIRKNCKHFGKEFYPIIELLVDFLQKYSHLLLRLPNMAARRGLLHENLAIDGVAQRPHMRDNPNKPAAARQFQKHLHRGA